MGLVSWLFRAVGRLLGNQKPNQGRMARERFESRRAEELLASPLMMTTQERQQKIDETEPEEMKYAGWRSVDSSWIKALNYNPLVPFAQMEVIRTGKIYTFGGMTLKKYKAWVNSGSKGTFFNRELKGQFTRWAGFPEIQPPDVYSFAGGTGSVPVSRR